MVDESEQWALYGDCYKCALGNFCEHDCLGYLDRQRYKKLLKKYIDILFMPRSDYGKF